MTEHYKGIDDIATPVEPKVPFTPYARGHAGVDCSHGIPLKLPCGACRHGGTGESGGTKHDQGKPRMELIDSYAMEQLAEVLTFGAKKYAPHNWRGGIAYSRLIAACLRHIFAWVGGQDNDPETGLSHLAHAMCCIMFILGLSNVSSDNDDRYKPSSKEKTNG